MSPTHLLSAEFVAILIQNVSAGHVVQRVTSDAACRSELTSLVASTVCAMAIALETHPVASEAVLLVNTTDLVASMDLAASEVGFSRMYLEAALEEAVILVNTMDLVASQACLVVSWRDLAALSLDRADSLRGCRMLDLVVCPAFLAEGSPEQQPWPEVLLAPGLGQQLVGP